MKREPGEGGNVVYLDSHCEWLKAQRKGPPDVVAQRTSIAADRHGWPEGACGNHLLLLAGVAAREQIGGVLGAELDGPLAGRQQCAPIAMRVARQQVDKPAL